MDVKNFCRNFFVGIFSLEFFRRNFFVESFSSEFFSSVVGPSSVVRPSSVRPSESSQIESSVSGRGANDDRVRHQSFVVSQQIVPGVPSGLNHLQQTKLHPCAKLTHKIAAAAAAAAAKISAWRRHRKKKQDFYENLETKKLQKT